MIEQRDGWLDRNGPVALIVNEGLVPVTGRNAVVFPPTFAGDKETGTKAGYVIDDGVCLMDTAGSQANRIEPLFLKDEYAKLVPQIVVQVGERRINLLEAGHRAADAVVRFSGLWGDLRAAFLAIREEGNAEKLARIAPTSFVFGAWDSRDTQVKLPRLVESTVRAYGAVELQRAAQYFSSIEEDTRKEMGIDAGALGDRNFPAKWGLVDNPSGRVHGGIIARDGIRREGFLNLVALRAIRAGTEERTRALQRYILGLSLVAFLAPAELYLRQGCLLTAEPGDEGVKKTVYRDGRQEALELSEGEAAAYAQEAARQFGVGPDRETVFDANAVKQQAKDKKKK